MSLPIDILIVFADADNKPSKETGLSWVTQFKKFLEFMLTQVINEKPKILLKGEYDTLTSPRLDNVSILIPILSKDFISSSACMQNVETFFNVVNKNAHRIFKVTKSPLMPQEQPDYLRPLIGYEMYQLDPDSGDVREFTDYFSTDAERQYWMEIVDLSYDISGMLFRLKNGTPEPIVKDIFNQKVLYLAETSQDLTVERNIITRELQRYGYTVLPDRALPIATHDIENIVKKDLEECTMSIHMIGNGYGDILNGSAHSIVDLQHKIAAEKSLQAKRKNETFTRLIWIAPNLRHINERQRQFIENIKRDVETQEGAEILETPLEDFKNIIREELLEAIDRKSIKETGGRAIYLLHDKVDHQEVRPYIDLIEKCGFRVLLPSFGVEILEQRQKHIENLRALDAVIIYKGTVNEQWVRMKALDLAKAPGLGRKKPIIAKAILVAPGGLNNPNIFKTQSFRIIECDAQYFEDSIKSFLTEFNT